MAAYQRITVDPDQIQADQLTLTAEQAHYLRRVLRLPSGGRFIAQDGRGQRWLAALTPEAAHIVQALEPAAPQWPPLVLAAALPKTGFDDVVRQVSELGVTQIQPLLSQRTLLKPSAQKLVRWQRIAQEASEQSERVWTPRIASPISFQTWIHQETTEGSAYLCVARKSVAPLLSQIQQLLTRSPEAAISLTIGPEGGWTAEEISVAIAHNHLPVSLGSAVLRATTAAVAAVSVVSMAREQLI
ncbi:MAG: 16S rRNA (uracil(1498)-N(3))-methyltransferase [Leptolyngbya sp. SIO4C1]|nr:16S rRNA (uracil(1498)-N(3))-methyltransferase [Leptolyngbya sp. SIO4C1]